MDMTIEVLQQQLAASRMLTARLHTALATVQMALRQHTDGPKVGAMLVAGNGPSVDDVISNAFMHSEPEMLALLDDVRLCAGAVALAISTEDDAFAAANRVLDALGRA